MKKLLISALSCLMIISLFSSCEKKKGEEPTDAKKYFNIEVTDVSAAGATVTFTPVDEKMTYLFGVMPVEKYNEDSIRTGYTKEYFENLIKVYSEYYEMNVYYADLFTIGAKEYKYNDLTPETEYVAVALGMDTVSFELTTPVVTRTFKTLAWEMKGSMTIEVSDISSIDAVVTVTPSDAGLTYLYAVVPTADYDEKTISSRWTKAYFDNILEYYSYVYEETLYYSDLFYQGKYKETCEDLTPETNYTVYAVGIDTVSFLMTTPIATKTFKTAKWEKIGEKELSFDHVDFMDAVDNYGWWQLFGYSETTDNTFYYISVSPAETETVAGNYTMEDMDLDYTLMVQYTINGNDTAYKQIDFVDGLFEVKETETGAEMEAVVNGSDGYEYTLHVVGTYSEDDEDYEDYVPARRKASARKVTVKRNQAAGIKKLNRSTR
ncbi:MAG: hypothetical protein J6Y00_03975 [Paludibacteraceae bacterium]|nr:hypothetical protein [Paludibacteraceae bacterium]